MSSSSRTAASPLTFSRSVSFAERQVLAAFAGLPLGRLTLELPDGSTRLFGDASARLANCPQTETINCELVNTSAWSELFGVPIAAYAVPAYLLVLILLWGGRRRPSMLATVPG